MSTTKDSKRILSVTVTREVDTDPDFSYLGEYSDDAAEYAIVACGEYKGTFVDQLPCECGHAESEHNDESECQAESCDGCIEFDRVVVERGREYRYFNSGSIESSNTEEDNRKYALQDFKRMEAYHSQDWYFVGISAKAEVQLTGDDLCQTIHSGGLWNIESDSEESYLTEIENEQLAELKSQLHAIGFSKRAIAAAFRNVVRETA